MTTKTTVTFVADDGTQFVDEQKCREYEELAPLVELLDKHADMPSLTRSRWREMLQVINQHYTLTPRVQP